MDVLAHAYLVYIIMMTSLQTIYIIKIFMTLNNLKVYDFNFLSNACSNNTAFKLMSSVDINKR